MTVVPLPVRIASPGVPPQISLMEMQSVEFGYNGSFREGLSRKRTPPIVDGVSFSIGRGAAIGLVGESGSGKSTIMRLLLGLVRPSRGEVRFKDTPIANVPRASFCRAVQAIFQDPFDSFNPRIRLIDQVCEPVSILHGGDIDTVRHVASQALRKVGIPDDVAARYPHQVSGGQAQRVAIARALALRPEVLLCDEPVSALDMSVQAQILNLLSDMQQSSAISIFFVSHDIRAVAHICEYIHVIRDGVIVESGRTSDVIFEPMHPYTNKLISAVPGLAEERRLVMLGNAKGVNSA